jgi:mannose-6-phosphate isomerase-like protein (cupin superfamily)
MFSDKEMPMKPKPQRSPVALAIAAAAVAGVFAGAVVAYGVPKLLSAETASATPGVGFASTVLARGIFDQSYTFGTPKVIVVKRTVRIKTKSGVVTRTAKFNVGTVQRAITCDPTDPCDTAFQQATIQPGGSSGWHTHPGATFVAVLQGEGTIYRVTGSGCTGTKIGVGTGFAQMPTELHSVHNEGTVPFVVYTLYVLPRGTPNTGIRVDQPQPTACPSIN